MAISTEINKDMRCKALEGKEPFCYKYFNEIMTDGVYLSSSNRSNFKIVLCLSEFLFSYSAGDI